MSKRSPILGYNHNVKHRGLLFHVQTEDSGVGNPHIFTHLFHGGVILATRKLDYDADAAVDIVKSLMQAQHKAALKDLKRGVLDAKIDQYFGDLPALQPPKNGAPSPGGDAPVAGVPGPVETEASEPTLPSAPSPGAETPVPVARATPTPAAKPTPAADHTAKPSARLTGSASRPIVPPSPNIPSGGQRAARATQAAGTRAKTARKTQFRGTPAAAVPKRPPTPAAATPATPTPITPIAAGPMTEPETPRTTTLTDGTPLIDVREALGGDTVPTAMSPDVTFRDVAPEQTGGRPGSEVTAAFESITDGQTGPPGSARAQGARAGSYSQVRKRRESDAVPHHVEAYPTDKIAVVNHTPPPAVPSHVRATEVPGAPRTPSQRPAGKRAGTRPPRSHTGSGERHIQSGVVVSRPAVIIGAPPKAIGGAPQEPRTPPRRAREDPTRTSLFGKDLISEKSLDEVILAYLSEDGSEE